MQGKPPRVQIENHYDAPPAFVAAWMTDYRPDDGRTWFDFPEDGKVEKTGTGYHVEGTVPRMGPNVNDITIQSPTHWTADGRMSNFKGRTIFKNHIDETVEPAGTGTLHRVQIWMEPQTFGARFMMIFGGRMMKRSLLAGFARMKTAIEKEYVQSPH